MLTQGVSEMRWEEKMPLSSQGVKGGKRRHVITMHEKSTSTLGYRLKWVSSMQLDFGVEDWTWFIR